MEGLVGVEVAVGLIVMHACVPVDGLVGLGFEALAVAVVEVPGLGRRKWVRHGQIVEDVGLSGRWKKDGGLLR